MLTRARWTPPLYHEDAKTNYLRLVRSFNEFLLSLEQQGMIDITEAGGDFNSLSIGNQGLSHKNRLIGGDFTINPWCRGTSFAAAADGTYTADRFVWNQSGAGVVTVQRTTDAPTADEAGYYATHCLDVDVTTADSSLAAGDIYTMSQKVEGLNAASFGFGQAGERYVTLSFWVKSTKTGVHCVSLRNSAANRAYVAEYTVFASNTWEYKTVTIPVDTSGTWLYDTGVGVTVTWCLAAGTNYQTTAVAWAAGNYVASANQVNCMDSTSNSFRIALCQLEPGKVATQFEWRHKAIEDKLCGRYAMGLNAEYIGYFLNASVGYSGMVMYPSEMRAAPTLATGATFTVTGGAAGTPAITFVSTKMCEVYNSAGNWTANNSGTITGVLVAEL